MRLFLFLFLASATVLLVPGATSAAAEVLIPADSPDDTVMASPARILAVRDWADRAFTAVPPDDHEPVIRVELRRQDHSVLRFGQSCLETPLRIGDRRFERGLGTHANSEIVLHLPAGARTFRAWVGIDHNDDTRGENGSARFIVEAAGKQLFLSPTLRGPDAPLAVEVALPGGTRELVLRTDCTEDGTSFDQADWAAAELEFGDGRRLWADQDRQALLAPGEPFSFVYGGQASADLLGSWEKSAEITADGGRQVRTVHWLDPASGLRVTATATTFDRHPAAEWVLHFENTGAADTPLLENIQPLDVVLRTGNPRKAVTLRQITGDVCAEQSFLPQETTVTAGKPVSFAPVGGRPSNHTFPFFNVQYGDQGLITAIGWSGQWAVNLDRSDRNPTRLQAGMEQTRLTLHPGERIRSPRILVMPWQGDLSAAHNRFRRLLLFEYVPQQDGRPVVPPAALQCFDRYSWTRPEWSTEAGQIRAANTAADLGFDTHWLDAAWFEGGFPNGVGNWFCRLQGFPRGLKPVGDACRGRGLSFMLWFEPERVAPGTRIAREHPEFVHGGGAGGLFKLDDPAARRWLTELLSAHIKEFGVDCYRNDFNLDPLPFWRAADPPGRQGITEIRYVEGHYALWDELRRRHPGLLIDNCASGGRRIDLETIMRSVPMWRSDTGCAPGHADWDQAQTLGLGLYLPLFGSCAWDPASYVMRSSASAAVISQFDYLDGQFPARQAKAALAEVKENRKYWYGDFYPLTRAGTGADIWAAWQLHRPDLGGGIVLAFRRAACPYPALQVDLRGLDPDQAYQVDFIDEEQGQRREILSGRQLTDAFQLELPAKATSLLLRYRRQDQP